MSPLVALILTNEWVYGLALNTNMTNEVGVYVMVEFSPSRMISILVVGDC